MPMWSDADQAEADLVLVQFRTDYPDNFASMIVERSEYKALISAAEASTLYPIYEESGGKHYAFDSAEDYLNAIGLTEMQPGDAAVIRRLGLEVIGGFPDIRYDFEGDEEGGGGEDEDDA